MGLFDKISKSIIYHTTDKPKHYVHIDKPKTNQEKRQVQYNNWCKRYGVYNGSYLPKQPKTLEHKGWNDVTKSTNGDQRRYERKSSGQVVRYDNENEGQYGHYHWKNDNPTKRPGGHLMQEYLDRYGKPCTDRGLPHHLAPLDKDYKEKKK